MSSHKFTPCPGGTPQRGGDRRRPQKRGSELLLVALREMENVLFVNGSLSSLS